MTQNRFGSATAGSVSTTSAPKDFLPVELVKISEDIEVFEKVLSSVKTRLKTLENEMQITQNYETLNLFK